MLNIFFPFFDTAKNYNLKKLKSDIIAGLTVAIVALPQSMAYAIIAGVHPKYGLYAAIMPVIISSLFGSSRYLIAGPTNAISMLIFSTISTLSIGGVAIINLPEEEKMRLIFLLPILVGLLQIAMGSIKLGNLINFVSHSVIIGFTAGAGLLIAFNQLKNLLGLSFESSPHFIENLINVYSHITQTNLFSLAVGLFTIALILILKKFSPRLPNAFIALTISTFVVWFFDLQSHGVKLIGSIPQNLPPLSMPSFSFSEIKSLLTPVFAISILAIVEALSIAKSIANSSGEKINGNQEFIAQGLANLSAGFFSAIPGTGSFTRSAVNFKSGAATRFAGAFSGLIVLSIILVFAPLAKFIPVAGLAGILFVIAYSMIDKESLKFSYRATTSDKTVLIITFLSTIFLELEKAVFIGVSLSVILFVRKISYPQIYKMCPRLKDNKLEPYQEGDRYCPQIKIYEIRGPLFFGAISELEEQLFCYKHRYTKTVIIRMKYIRMIDATGAHTVKKFINYLKEKNIKLILVGVNPGVMKVFKRTGLIEHIGKENIAPDTTWAIDFAFNNYIDKNECQKCQQRIFKECQNEIKKQSSDEAE